MVLLGDLQLHYFLSSWDSKLKCSKIILSKQRSPRHNFIFYLNALDYRQKKSKKNNKVYSEKLIDFYLSIFDKESNRSQVKACVNNYTTFFIQVHNKKNKEENDIIATVTFLYDELRENVFILWLGVLKIMPDKFKNTYLDDFGDSFQKNSFGTFLIMTVIKFCKVVNKKKTDIWLQVSNLSKITMNFYTNNGFYYAGKKNNVHNNLRSKLKRHCWIEQDDMYLMKSSNGYFKATIMEWNKIMQEKKG